MKTVYLVIAPMLLLGFVTYLLAYDRTGADNLKELNQEQISIRLGEEFSMKFHRQGDRLLQPQKSKISDPHESSVKVRLAMTADSPFPPPREGATRPYLSIEHNFDQSLCFRVRVRLKGDQTFHEISDEREPLPAGEVFNLCWNFDSRIEEVSLSEFKFR